MNRAAKRAYAKKINTPQKLEGFYKNVDYKLRQEYDKAYEDKFNIEMEKAIDTFILSIVYTLHYNEKCKFGNARIQDFMNDLFITVDCFRTGEYVPEDYQKQLEEDGIKIILHEEKKDGRNLERHS
jgi:hypothetical protein